MGFGLLFLGYFFILNVPYGSLDVLPDIIGCLLMLSALKRLTGYCSDNRGFKYTQFTLLPYTLIAAIIFISQLACQFGITSAESIKWFTSPLNIVYSIVIGAFHIFLFLGIHELSKEVDLPKITTRSIRMLSLTVVYYIIELLSYTGIINKIAYSTAKPEAVLSYINLALFILGILWMALTWALIFTCYIRICLEGDEDMPYREDIFDKILSYFKRQK
ncbi:MAG: hypothetical protein HFE63_08475 [Clostridiales bacterium]|nr:hypothetical protein [Clostridiales bacterium]